MALAQLLYPLDDLFDAADEQVWAGQELFRRYPWSPAFASATLCRLLPVIGDDDTPDEQVQLHCREPFSRRLPHPLYFVE